MNRLSPSPDQFAAVMRQVFTFATYLGDLPPRPDFSDLGSEWESGGPHWQEYAAHLERSLLITSSNALYYGWQGWPEEISEPFDLITKTVLEWRTLHGAKLMPSDAAQHIRTIATELTKEAEKVEDFLSDAAGVWARNINGRSSSIETRKQAAVEKQEDWQRRANEIWQRHPNEKVLPVARMVANQYDASERPDPDVVRKKIKKPTTKKLSR